eukprot:4985170-Pyramimonas_sp.AAC.1
MGSGAWPRSIEGGEFDRRRRSQPAKGAVAARHRCAVRGPEAPSAVVLILVAPFGNGAIQLYPVG